MTIEQRPQIATARARADRTLAARDCEAVGAQPSGELEVFAEPRAQRRESTDGRERIEPHGERLAHEEPRIDAHEQHERVQRCGQERGADAIAEGARRELDRRGPTRRSAVVQRCEQGVDVERREIDVGICDHEHVAIVA